MTYPYIICNERAGWLRHSTQYLSLPTHLTEKVIPILDLQPVHAQPLCACCESSTCSPLRNFLAFIVHVGQPDEEGFRVYP